MPGEIQFVHQAAVGGEGVKLIVSGSPPRQKSSCCPAPGDAWGIESHWSYDLAFGIWGVPPATLVCGSHRFMYCIARVRRNVEGETQLVCARASAKSARGCVLAVFLEIGVTTAPFLQNIMQTVGQFLGTYNVDGGGQTGSYVYPTIGQDVKPAVWYNTAQMAGAFSQALDSRQTCLEI